MPVSYVYNNVSYRKHAVLRAEVKLIVPVFDIAKAISGIRTHVFESEEYKVHTQHQKVRSNYTWPFSF